jgi:hypothetical protein
MSETAGLRGAPYLLWPQSGMGLNLGAEKQIYYVHQLTEGENLTSSLR